MKNLLITERWRPKKFEDIILLPRVKKIFENGLDNNILLYGNFGSGKTTLARILIGKYDKSHPFIEINSSFHTSIDTLRNKVDEFCSKVYMGIDLENDIDKNSIKYVFLDEFDRTSLQYQDALKAYIEEYSSKNVRFILTTNHINKISPGIRSRLTEVCFDCQTVEEEKYLKQEIFKKIKNVICPIEKIQIDKNELATIINKNFPDFRSTLIDLDNFKLTGNIQNGSQINLKLKVSTYDLVINKNLTYENIYDFILSNYGPDGIFDLIKIFGKDFIDYSIENNLYLDKLFKVNSIVCDYTFLLEKSSDPIVLSMALIGKLREILMT